MLVESETDQLEGEVAQQVEEEAVDYKAKYEETTKSYKSLQATHEPVKRELDRLKSQHNPTEAIMARMEKMEAEQANNWDAALAFLDKRLGGVDQEFLEEAKSPQRPSFVAQHKEEKARREAELETEKQRQEESKKEFNNQVNDIIAELKEAKIDASDPDYVSEVVNKCYEDGKLNTIKLALKTSSYIAKRQAQSAKSKARTDAEEKGLLESNTLKPSGGGEPSSEERLRTRYPSMYPKKK